MLTWRELQRKVVQSDFRKDIVWEDSEKSRIFLMQMRNVFWETQSIAPMIFCSWQCVSELDLCAKRTRIDTMLLIVLPVVVIVIALMLALVVMIVPVVGSDRVRQRSHHAAPDIGRHLERCGSEMQSKNKAGEIMAVVGEQEIL